MKKFIEKNPALILTLMVIVGCGAFLVGGVALHVMIGLASVTSKYIITMVACLLVGVSFTLIPATYLYDLVNEYRGQASDLRYELRVRAGRNATPRPRAREANHWLNPESADDDDLDGDGEGDDSLRRLGLIQ
jgi:cell division protein FtsW (lipid II flippase)